MKDALPVPSVGFFCTSFSGEVREAEWIGDSGSGVAFTAAVGFNKGSCKPGCTPGGMAAFRFGVGIGIGTGTGIREVRALLLPASALDKEDVGISTAEASERLRSFGEEVARVPPRLRGEYCGGIAIPEEGLSTGDESLWL
jgi:hypothetical protein